MRQAVIITACRGAMRPPNLALLHTVGEPVKGDSSSFFTKRIDHIRCAFFKNLLKVEKNFRKSIRLIAGPSAFIHFPYNSQGYYHWVPPWILSWHAAMTRMSTRSIGIKADFCCRERGSFGSHSGHLQPKILPASPETDCLCLLF
jgi:hypothetical protein